MAIVIIAVLLLLALHQGDDGGQGAASPYGPNPPPSRQVVHEAKNLLTSGAPSLSSMHKALVDAGIIATPSPAVVHETTKLLKTGAPSGSSVGKALQHAGITGPGGVPLDPSNALYNPPKTGNAADGINKVAGAYYGSTFAIGGTVLCGGVAVCGAAAGAAGNYLGRTGEKLARKTVVSGFNAIKRLF